MLFEITHTTHYNYMDKVFLEPHCFRFKPKVSPFIAIKDFTFKIDPQPAGLSEQIDVENNHNLFGWFDGFHDQLKINVRSIVDIQEHNPFSFLVYPPEYLNLPFEYDFYTNQLLEPALTSEDFPKTMFDYCHEILIKSNNKSIDFLVNLTQQIHNDFSLKSRKTGSPHHSEYTFGKKTGSCRDLAWMQIQMLRKTGIACRFVSGYYYLDIDNPEYELHAWVEAYLPGAGWIGLDPGHGILTGTSHIQVASSAYFKNTMPVSGTIRGNATSKMTNELNIIPL
jgi:transglutaminase-like putative cysteine protease